MKKFSLIITCVLFSILCMAQNSALDDFIASANSRCPMTFSDAWTVESFTCESDTVTTTIALTGEAANYLPMIAANAGMVKNMWLGQMAQYGEEWNNFAALVAGENKTLVVMLHSKDNATSVAFTFSPDELKTSKL